MDNILLEGGKGGGGGSFTEDDNSLKSVTWVKTLEGLGYGLQQGPVNGVRSIYLDDTPLYDANFQPNFKDVSVEWRTGTPSQSLIPGFEDVNATISVASDVTFAAPITRTVSSADVGAVSVTIKLPQGLYNQNTTDNKLERTTLNFRVQHKLTSSGTWITALDKTYNDKTTGPFEESFRINRPTGTGTWDVRVVRMTADSVSSTLKNGLQFAYFTEHIIEPITYPNVALLAVSLNAAGVNNSRIPTRSVDWYGRIIQIPNNFNPNTRKYTGTWNLSTFQNKWCNDPAWVLYDLATDATVGLGLSSSQIDLASFYACSIYNSERVDYIGTDGITYAGPRFSFNAPITEAMSAVDWMKKVASMMNATILWVNGQLTIKQDRPDTYVAVFTNANVVDGRFSRSGTPADTRYTVCNVTWNAPDDGYKQRVTSVVTDDAAALLRYGHVETSVAAFGCTSLSQAIRYGRWIVDTSLNTTGTITFTTGEIGATIVPGDVIRIYDNEYAGASSAGRLLTGSTTSVINLDRSVSLSADATITIWDVTGTIYSDVAITTTGTASTITLTTPLAAAPGENAIFQITTNSISPELYRIISRDEQEPGRFTIVAGQYDENKWARVEGTTQLYRQQYVKMPLPVVSPPTGLTFAERSVYLDLSVKRSLYITWTPVPSEIVSGYRVTYAVNGGNRITQDVKMPFIELDVTAGTVQVTVQSLSYKTIPSQPVSGTYTMASTETTGSVLNAPTNLVVSGTAGTTFTTRDLIVSWTNPTTNGSTTAGVARFKVEIYNGATLLRSDYVSPVAPGQTQTYTYSYDDNVVDGGPRRSPIVKVYCQDASLKLSSAVTATMTNAAPAAPSAPAASGGVGNIFVTFTAPTDVDYKGTIVWASLTNGFTPASGNVVYDGSDSVVQFKSLGAGAHYIKVAHYDAFAKDYAGTGLNLSAQLTATPASTGGIQSGTALPGTGAEGDLFFNTADGKLYRYHSGAWTAAVPTLDLTGTITTTQITDSAITTPKIATNAITTNKLFVAGRGQEMNADPAMTDTTAWSGSSVPTLVTGITDIPTGGSTAITNATNSNAVIVMTEYIPLDSTFNYRIETTAKQTSGTTGVVYFGVIWYDAAKVALAASGATGWVGTGTGSYFVSNSVLPTTWTNYSGSFGPNETAKQHPSAKFVRLVAFLNQTSIAGSVCAVARHALIRKTAGEVIVDGTLAASKLVANSITAGQIAASAIGADEIAANSVITSKLLVSGKGKALNDDPTCSDISAWTVNTGSAVVQADTTVPVGSNSILLTNATFIQSRAFPVEAGKKYKVSLYAKKGTVGGGMYLRMYAYAATGGTEVSYAVTGLVPVTTTFENITVAPGVWTRYTGYVVPAATAAYAKASLHANWNTTGTMTICDFRIEEHITADLVVDGLITAGSAIITDGAITNAKIGNAISSSDFDGVINSSGVMTSTGTRGWGIAKGDGTAGSSKIVIDAATIRGTLTTDQIAVGAVTNITEGNSILISSSPEINTVISSNRTSYTDLAANVAVSSSWTVYTYDWTCPAGINAMSPSVLNWTNGPTRLYMKTMSVFKLIGGAGSAITGANLLTNNPEDYNIHGLCDYWTTSEGVTEIASDTVLPVRPNFETDPADSSVWTMAFRKNSTAGLAGFAHSQIMTIPGTTYRIYMAIKGSSATASGLYIRLNQAATAITGSKLYGFNGPWNIRGFTSSAGGAINATVNFTITMPVSAPTAAWDLVYIDFSDVAFTLVHNGRSWPDCFVPDFTQYGRQGGNLIACQRRGVGTTPTGRVVFTGSRTMLASSDLASGVAADVWVSGTFKMLTSGMVEIAKISGNMEGSFSCTITENKV